jgi:ubiquinone/menaquinone biosynthesis C-methylase UbiE
MRSQDQPKREHPSTYFVQDRSNLDEMTRLSIQDQALTMGMGGVLPELPDPTVFERILDVGCGTGGWLIETAKMYPMVSTLVGIDISSKILEYARAQAEIQQVSDRVRFQLMDALSILEFPGRSFDLVNQRFGSSYLRTWDWPQLLDECKRVTRSGGVVRFTEPTMIEGNSPALTSMVQVFFQVLDQAGRYFNHRSDGLVDELPCLLDRHGFQNIQTRTYTLHYRAGTPEGQCFFEDMKLICQTLVPFYRKWTRLPDDYQTTYQQMLDEMQQPDFVATWTLFTVWGNV